MTITIIQRIINTPTIIAFIIGFMPFLLNASNPIELTTKIWPPYQYYDEDNALTGRSIKIIECAFKQVNRPFEIRVLPWARAQQQVEINHADGFFSASRNDQRDQFAVRSEAIADQNWTWFYLDSNLDPTSVQFKENIEVAATNGSNIENWLIDNNYKLQNVVTNTNNLLQMLIKGRIGVFMANEAVIEQMIQDQNIQIDIHKSTVRSMPVGIYFSKSFLELQPTHFMENINQAIRDCRQSTL